MKYAIVFILLGLACIFYAATSHILVIRLFSASVAIALFCVGLAFAFIGQRAFLKKPNGQLSLLSYFLYWPYHLLNWFSLICFRHCGGENAYDKIEENVYLGCRLSHSDKQDIESMGIKSVLDLTCEFSEILPLRRLSYHCIPILDTRAPSLAELKAGAEWINQKITEGPVYVHCALGHGRSATFVAAYLLLAGKAKTPQEAIDKIKILRPKISLHPEQFALLKKITAER